MSQDPGKIERDLDQERKRLKQAEQQAEDLIDDAEQLSERAEEQRHDAERLRRKAREPLGPKD